MNTVSQEWLQNVMDVCRASETAGAAQAAVSGRMGCYWVDLVKRVVRSIFRIETLDDSKTTDEAAPIWDAAYHQVYELAKKGNAICQTVIGRAVLDGETEIIGENEAIRLVRKAADARYPPAFLVMAMHCASLGSDCTAGSLCVELLMEATHLGCAEAECISMVNAFCHSTITAQELLDSLMSRFSPSHVVSCLLLERLMELDRKLATAQAREEKLRELEQKLALSRQQHLDAMHGKNVQLREVRHENAELLRKISELSSSALVAENARLQSELATSCQRQVEAEARFAAELRALDARYADEVRNRNAMIADAVRVANEERDKALLERDVADAGRDTALRQVEKSEHITKQLQRWMRRHGFDPQVAFIDGEVAMDEAS